MDPLPDLAELDNAGLKALMHAYEAEELDVSYRRRVLHGKIDLLKAELTRRLKADYQRGGSDALFGEGDVDRLASILAGTAVAEPTPDDRPAAPADPA